MHFIDPFFFPVDLLHQAPQCILLVINYQQLLDCGSYAAARDKGLVRMEGKEYVVQDGDLIVFRFNV